MICSPLMTTRPLTAGSPTLSSLDCHTDPVPTQRPLSGQERARRAPCSAAPPAHSSQRKCWRPCARQTGRGGTWSLGCPMPAVNGAAVRAKSARCVKGRRDPISCPSSPLIHSNLKNDGGEAVEVCYYQILKYMCVRDVGIADFIQSEEPVCHSVQKLLISALVVLLYGY